VQTSWLLTNAVGPWTIGSPRAVAVAVAAGVTVERDGDACVLSEPLVQPESINITTATPAHRLRNRIFPAPPRSSDYPPNLNDSAMDTTVS
jgi:hypothetical protein